MIEIRLNVYFNHKHFIKSVLRKFTFDLHISFIINFHTAVTYDKTLTYMILKITNKGNTTQLRLKYKNFSLIKTLKYTNVV